MNYAVNWGFKAILSVSLCLSVSVSVSLSLSLSLSLCAFVCVCTYSHVKRSFFGDVYIQDMFSFCPGTLLTILFSSGWQLKKIN